MTTRTQDEIDMAAVLALMSEMAEPAAREIAEILTPPVSEPTSFRSIHEWDDTTPHAESYAEWCERQGFEPPAREVTKLPEVHDPAGDDLQFHIPAGRATQVLGSREIDISRIPDTQNVAVTDSNGRALPTRSAVARDKAITDALAGNEPLAKLMRKYGGKHFSFTMSR